MNTNNKGPSIKGVRKIAVGGGNWLSGHMRTWGEGGWLSGTHADEGGSSILGRPPYSRV